MRGLGVNETLVLIDGRVVSGPSLDGSSSQPDLAMIPMTEIERVDMLPASDSAVYGGGATGGVINVVRVSHYLGTDIRASYGSSWKGSSDVRQMSVTHGSYIARTRTYAMGSLSFYDESSLLAGDRDFGQRARDLRLANIPGLERGRSPPVGKQTNIRVVDNASSAGQAPSLISHVPAHYTLADGAGPLLAAGRYNLHTPNSAQADGGSAYGLRPASRTTSASLVLSEVFKEGVEGFVDISVAESVLRTPRSAADIALLGARIPADAPHNPVHRELIVSVPVEGADGVFQRRHRAYRGVGGVNFSVRTWRVGVEYAWSKSRFEIEQPWATSAFAAIASGELNILRDLEDQPLDLTPYLRTLRTTPLDFSIGGAALRLHGTAFDAPAGAATLSAHFEHRDERFSGGRELIFDATGGAPMTSGQFARQARAIDSVYSELLIPLVSSEESGRGEHLLDLRVAKQLGHNDTTTEVPRLVGMSGESTEATHSSFRSNNTTIGLRQRIARAVWLRASWGTGFLPPSAPQLAAPRSRIFPEGSLIDSRRPLQPTGRVHFRAGGNEDLAPEESESWSFGINVSPPRPAGLNVSLDYTRTAIRDAILDPSNLAISDPAAYERIFPDRVEREVVADPAAIGPIVYIDGRAINAARLLASAFDLKVAYDTPETSFGKAMLSVEATYQPTLEKQPTPGSPAQNEIGLTAGAPQRIGARSQLVLERNAWTLAFNTSYHGSYTVSPDPNIIRAQGSRKVRAQMYHDLSLSYRLPEWSAMPADGEIRLGVQNVLNAEPPLDMDTRGGVGYSTLGDPRLRTVRLSLIARFGGCARRAATPRCPAGRISAQSP